MHIVFEHSRDLLNGEKGFGEKIVNEIIDNITKQLTIYCQEEITFYKEKYDVDLDVIYNVLRADQAIVDTLEDLMRLKEFHPVEYPNRLKCAAYFAYWWLQRQPLLNSVSEDDLGKISREDIARMIHTNANFVLAYVLSEVFTDDKLCVSNDPKYEEQWTVELDYLFYFFCYRANSPKSIEAFLSTAIVHPLWRVKEGVYFEE